MPRLTGRFLGGVFCLFGGFGAGCDRFGGFATGQVGVCDRLRPVGLGIVAAVTAKPVFRASFGDLLRQVSEVKQSLSRPAAEPPSAVERPGRVGADPFSVGGVVGLAAAAAVAAGGSVGVADWHLDVEVPPAARRRRLRRAGGCEGWSFDGDRLVRDLSGPGFAGTDSTWKGDFDV